MSRFGPSLFDPDALGTVHAANVVTWLAEYFGTENPSSLSGPAPDSGSLAIGLDSGYLAGWLAGEPGSTGSEGDHGIGSASDSPANSALADFGIVADGASTGGSDGFGASDLSFPAEGFGVREIAVAFPQNGFSDVAWTDDDPGQSVSATAQDGGRSGGQDLIFLDDTSFAKGGTKGGSSGGGGGGGHGGGGNTSGGDPNALSEYTSGGDSATSYNIKIDFQGTWTSDLQQAFIQSADLLSSIITDDVSDVFYRGKVIDDIVITAELQDIDGAGGVLGQAGPTAVRTANYLPGTATMQFDVADADAFNNVGLWEEIVLHEMLHSVGFGSIWGFLGLVDDSDPNAPVFLGENANAEYGDYVPVEGDGGSGTALSHWDDTTFTTEIMTGYLYTDGVASNVDYDLANGYVTLGDDPSVSDLSDMTVASLEDLGYATVWTPDAPAIA